MGKLKQLLLKLYLLLWLESKVVWSGGEGTRLGARIPVCYFWGLSTELLCDLGRVTSLCHCLDCKVCLAGTVSHYGHLVYVATGRVLPSMGGRMHSAAMAQAVAQASRSRISCLVLWVHTWEASQSRCGHTTILRVCLH